jgi:hypothetical protein
MSLISPHKAFQILNPETRMEMVTIPDRDVSGWVGTEFLIVGTERQYGHWAVRQVTGSRPNTTTIPNSSITPRDPSLLAGTISALLETFAHNSELLENIADESRALIGSAESRARVVELAINGSKRADTYETLKDGNFTITQLIEVATDAGEAKGVRGCYMRFYVDDSDAEDESEELRRICIGSAVDIKERMSTHKIKFSSHNSNHVVTFRSATEMHFWVLCVLDEEEDGDNDSCRFYRRYYKSGKAAGRRPFYRGKNTHNLRG